VTTDSAVQLTTSDVEAIIRSFEYEFGPALRLSPDGLSRKVLASHLAQFDAGTGERIKTPPLVCIDVHMLTREVRQMFVSEAARHSYSAIETNSVLAFLHEDTR